MPAITVNMADEPLIRADGEVGPRETAGRFSALWCNFRTLRPADQQKVCDLAWKLAQKRLDAHEGEPS